MSMSELPERFRRSLGVLAVLPSSPLPDRLPLVGIRDVVTMGSSEFWSADRLRLSGLRTGECSLAPIILLFQTVKLY